MNYRIVIVPASAVAVVAFIGFLFVAIINQGIGVAAEKVSVFLNAHQGVVIGISCAFTAFVGGGLTLDELAEADEKNDGLNIKTVIGFVCGALTCLPIGVILGAMV